jgi:hypothetical protein
MFSIKINSSVDHVEVLENYDGTWLCTVAIYTTWGTDGYPTHCNLKQVSYIIPVIENFSLKYEHEYRT